MSTYKIAVGARLKHLLGGDTGRIESIRDGVATIVWGAGDDATRSTMPLVDIPGLTRPADGLTFVTSAGTEVLAFDDQWEDDGNWEEES